MSALIEWIEEVGGIAIFIGLVSIGFRFLGRAFKGKINFM